MVPNPLSIVAVTLIDQKKRSSRFGFIDTLERLMMGYVLLLR